MAISTSQLSWVDRVLDVQVANAPRAPRPPRGKLLPIWIEAKESVDAGIGKLQDAMRAEADEDLTQIAEFGLYGATDGENVRLMAALREADGGRDEALDELAEAADDYLAFLAAAPIVELIEDNPFGVAVPMRATLEPALREIRRVALA